MIGYRKKVRELMKDKEYAERLGKAREWHEIIAVIREFAEKKGYKFAEIYEEKPCPTG